MSTLECYFTVTFAIFVKLLSLKLNISIMLCIRGQYKLLIYFVAVGDRCVSTQMYRWSSKAMQF